jgi:hypothetical protein
MGDGACYRNAYLRALTQGWIYCEGIALTSLDVPVQHAWCVMDGDAVVETTWREAGHGYLGIPMTIKHVAEWALKQRSCGSVLESDWWAARSSVTKSVTRRKTDGSRNSL